MSKSDQIIIIGAGIVGSSLAKCLASKGVPVLLVDRNLSGPSLNGATGHAPGLVGQLSFIDTLTELAKRSLLDYKTIPGAFTNVGGLELAMSETAIATLDARERMAHRHGIPARRVTGAEARGLAPSFVDDRVTGGLFFPDDGTVNAIGIAMHDRAVARTEGAELLETSVKGFIRDDRGQVVGIRTDKGDRRGNKVVITTGLWTRQLDASLPVYPVSHPYSLSLHRTPKKPSPFIRWPEQHVYGRDHGLFDGVGTYDHSGDMISPDQLPEVAYGPWHSHFDKLLEKAYALVPSSTSFAGSKPFNGILTVTPDGVPLVGEVEHGLFCAVAVWVTHAAGSAELLARLIIGEALTEKERGMLQALEPRRFAGQAEAVLRKKTMEAYGDILHTDKDAKVSRQAKL